jgi:hypothetical protein
MRKQCIRELKSMGGQHIVISQPMDQQEWIF